MKDFYSGKTVLITGGTGSWGQELTSQLLSKHSPKEIRIYSRGEHKQVDMKRRFQNPKITYHIGDVRDYRRLNKVMRGTDIAFHLAALKHVPICEENPWEAVQTNVVGTQNLIDAALENNVSKVIDVSTDKAVDPLNLYGLTKAAGERLIIAANLNSPTTRFVCVRGGNVLGTTGSVIPLFKSQIEKLNKVTITDENMTRFFMSVKEAISMLLYAAANSVGGEIYVMKTGSCTISTLADVMIKNLGNSKTKKEIIGVRPGEKTHEVLISRHEAHRTLDKDGYYIILPSLNIKKTVVHYQKLKYKKFKGDEFSSLTSRSITPTELTALLKKEGWLEKDGGDSYNQALEYIRHLKPASLERFAASEGWPGINNK